MNDLTKPRPTLQAAALTGFVALLSLGFAGCKGKTQAQVPGANGDPADANLAQPYTGASSTGQAQVLGQTQSYTSQANSESYESQTPAPIIRQAPARSAATQTVQYYPVPQAQSAGNGYPQGYDNQASYDPNIQGYDDAEQAGEQALAETDQPPPPLPEYDQPPAPADDYLWTPGYWDYAQTGYYWVPGAWVAPPFYGALWTPPYWAYERNHYICHRGYWGSHVGYYGGINYGFGYIGFGYFGGYWRDHDFYYNRAVTNVNVVNVHNVYNRTVVYEGREYGPRPYDRVSYNGGRGGLNIQPRPQEIAAMREAHYAPLPDQRQNRMAAATNRSQFFAANGGRPAQPFVGRPIGTVNNIPAAPRQQAFNVNRNGAPSQPAFAGRPGDYNRLGTQPNQPAYNNNRPGDYNRPGTQPNQPAYNYNRPGDYSHPGTQPNQPAYNNNPSGDYNRPAAQPNQQVVTPSQPGNFRRPAGGAYTPAPNQPAPNQPAASQPPVNQNRPNGIYRGAQPNEPRPTYNQARPAQPQPQPQPHQQPQPRQNFDQRAPQPQFQQRGNFDQRAPQTQPQPRQSFEQPRPVVQAQPQARPQVSAPRPAAPAPAAAPHVDAPRGGGQPHGNDHGHNQ